MRSLASNEPPAKALPQSTAPESMTYDVPVCAHAAVASRERVGELRGEAGRLGLREQAAGLDEHKEVPARAKVEHEVDDD
nr:unnamed protein product [Digitaria exilis]